MNFKLGETYFDFRLTTESPASHYDIPVVVDKDGNAYGPSDIVPIPPHDDEMMEWINAVFVEPERFDWMVYTWANKITCNELAQVTGMPRTREEIIAAAKFLAQWPEGLQINPEKVFEKWQWQLNHDDTNINNQKEENPEHHGPVNQSEPY